MTRSKAPLSISCSGCGSRQNRRALALQRTESYVELRLMLALAIELQLAADILLTAIAPRWDRIGKLGAIVVIRTGLNYFLMREMKEERVKSAGHA